MSVLVIVLMPTSSFSSVQACAYPCVPAALEAGGHNIRLCRVFHVFHPRLKSSTMCRVTISHC
ncbi:hypothetical protein PR003_g35057 [Phytophthora rubi]|uniref:Secreted protein n=1 Tax=Phytophthora rubi TaxID=129364 RepID=A0A6A4AND7_9STRA|nr:hypothetical protein PR003_g35057 [Phytophthora rubi]